jgi:hypothetical protein
VCVCVCVGGGHVLNGMNIWGRTDLGGVGGRGGVACQWGGGADARKSSGVESDM